MKIEINMCHTQLVAMLLNTEKFQRAVRSYAATTPNVGHEGMAGYIETIVTFNLNNLSEFNTLYQESLEVLTPGWYRSVRDGLLCKQ